jgi:DNA-binding MarR family transcriptional regulator
MTSGVPEPHLGAWRALLNAHASLVGRIEERLAATGLPPLTWYDVLWALRRAPERRLRMADLAAELTISRGGLTKLADRLEQAGLLRRESAEGDGRGHYAVLTDEGDATLGRIWPVYAGVLREAFVGAVSAAEADAIAAGLARAAEAARTPAA